MVFHMFVISLFITVEFTTRSNWYSRCSATLINPLELSIVPKASMWYFTSTNVYLRTVMLQAHHSKIFLYGNSVKMGICPEYHWVSFCINIQKNQIKMGSQQVWSFWLRVDLEVMPMRGTVWSQISRTEASSPE